MRNTLETNNVKCEGDLTFSKGRTWISQLDWRICSSKCIKNVKSFNIEKDTTLGTLMTYDLLSCAIKMKKSLGNSHEKTSTKYPLKMNNINIRPFLSNLPTTNSLWDIAVFNDPDAACETITTMLYD